MSRIGKMPVKILAGVKVDVKDGLVRVEGPKGKLQYRLPEGIEIKVANNEVLVVPNTEKALNAVALSGLARTLISNMVHGVHTEFTRGLEVVGVGYRAATKGNMLTLTVGFSHPIDFQLPAGVTAKVDANTKITISGADKQMVGEVASKIRGFRPPEPYQGKGIKYSDERIVRKQGKAAGAK